MSGHTDGWVGFDLDGTLAVYDRWRGIEHVGAPIKPIVAILREMVAEGRPVKIFTARVADEKSAPEVRRHVWAWLEKQGLPPIEITNIKDFQMISLYDDRAIQVVPNEGRLFVHPDAAGR